VRRAREIDTLLGAFERIVTSFRASSRAFWGKRGLDRWRGALHEALEPNGRLMVDRVPALTLLIGDQPPVPELAPQDAQCASLASC
jgi:predicted ATPase